MSGEISTATELRKNEKIIICRNCGKEAITWRHDQVYCDSFCNRQAKKRINLERVERQCKLCNKTYTITAMALKNSNYPNHCKPCIGKLTGEEKRSVKQCIVCGMSFKGVTEKRKFCSELCAVKSAGHMGKMENKEPEIGKRIRAMKNYPCATCTHGKANAASDTGFECLANARICKPFTLMLLYKANKASKEKKNAK